MTIQNTNQSRPRPDHGHDPSSADGSHGERGGRYSSEDLAHRQRNASRHERGLTEQPEPSASAEPGSVRHAVLAALCRHLEAAVPHVRCAVLLLDRDGTALNSAIGPSLPAEILEAWQTAAVDALAGHASDSLSGLERIVAAEAEARGWRLLLAQPVPAAGGGPARGLIVLICQDDWPATSVPQPDIAEVVRQAALALTGDDVTEIASASDAHERELIAGIPAVTYQRQAGAAGIAFISPQVETLLGWAPAEFPPHPDHWFAHVHADDRPSVQAAVAQATASGGPLDVEYRVVTPEGESLWVRDLAQPRVDASGSTVWHGVLVDISQEKSAEQRLHQLAFYDSLTGLPNRRLCIDGIESVLHAPQRPDVALLFIDLDRFKFINDGIGHAAGDELLVAVAQRLAERVAGHGSLARFGGDEFVALLVDADLPEVTELAGSLLAALREPFHVNGYELDVEGTIGIAFASPELSTPEELLRAADVALYRAKATGRGGFAIFDPAIDALHPDRFAQEAELRHALASNEFEVAYQPVVDIATGQVVAVEALVRWNHPQRGVLEPAEFITFADETGLIVPLGKWVIEEACRQLRQWQDAYPEARGLKVSVNLSGRQFRQASLPTDVALILKQTGLAPRDLALEIKEGDALADSGAIAAMLQEFRRLGVRVTIDDFGRGWAALGSLTRFTIDDLKIDGSCVSRLGQGKQDGDVVRALVSMAKAIGLDVTAGAVETNEQLEILKEIGCDRAQGRLLAPPLSVPELERLLQGADEDMFGATS